MATVNINSVLIDLTHAPDVIIVPLTKPGTHSGSAVWTSEQTYTLLNGAVTVVLAQGVYDLIFGMSKFSITVPSGNTTYNWIDILTVDVSAADSSSFSTSSQKRFFESATVEEMKAIVWSAFNWECRLLDVTSPGLYRWDLSGTDADDVPNVIRTNDFASYNQGVWKKFI